MGAGSSGLGECARPRRGRKDRAQSDGSRQTGLKAPPCGRWSRCSARDEAHCGMLVQPGLHGLRLSSSGGWFFGTNELSKGRSCLRVPRNPPTPQRSLAELPTPMALEGDELGPVANHESRVLPARWHAPRSRDRRRTRPLPHLRGSAPLRAFPRPLLGVWGCLSR